VNCQAIVGKGSVRWVVFVLALALASTKPSLRAADQSVVFVPASTFTMGTKASAADTEQKPAHEVFVDAFEIDRTEVTVGDYKKCIEAGVCGKVVSRYPELTSDAEYFATFKDDEPITEVNWFNANRYCQWAGKRLPTEAEWEKAARGPKEYLNPWGNRKFKKGDAAIGVPHVYPVGAFANDKSGYGVVDMAGNVTEWVTDWYSADYYRSSPQRNPMGPKEGTKKVVRGASWQTNIKGDLQSSFFVTSRFGVPPDRLTDIIGFRCAKLAEK